jgi:dipeptide/tripeptide permease
MFITVPTVWAVFVYQFNTSISFYDVVNQNSLSLSLSLSLIAHTECYIKKMSRNSKSKKERYIQHDYLL